MGIKFLSGFRGYDNAKQHLRRSVHAGSDLTSGNTVLNPAQAFDQQACFVYLNGVMQKEGSGANGDYTLSGTSTVACLLYTSPSPRDSCASGMAWLI